MDCEIEITEVTIGERRGYSNGEWVHIKFRGKKNDFECESEYYISIDGLLYHEVEKEILTGIYKSFKHAYEGHIEIEKTRQREEEVKTQAKALAGRKIEDIFKLVGELEE